jgi:hypothetical protein
LRVVPSAEKVPEVCVLDIGVWGTLSACGLIGGVGRRLRVVPAAEKVPEVCVLDIGVWGTLSADKLIDGVAPRSHVNCYS